MKITVNYNGELDELDEGNPFALNFNRELPTPTRAMLKGKFPHEWSLTYSPRNRLLITQVKDKTTRKTLRE
jgi:hypothetical protein